MNLVQSIVIADIMASKTTVSGHKVEAGGPGSGRKPSGVEKGQYDVASHPRKGNIDKGHGTFGSYSPTEPHTWSTEGPIGDHHCTGCGMMRIQNIPNYKKK